jgi:predicted phosphodiesterase
MSKKLLFFISIIIIISGYFYFRKPQQPEETIAPPKPSNAILSFAVMGDPEMDTQNLKKALERAQQEELEFAIIVGDLTSTGTPDEFKKISKILENSEIKTYLIPGNHDLWYSRKQGIDIWSDYFGPDYYAKVIEGFKFVFLNNGDEWQGLSQKQLNWLGHNLLKNEQFLSGDLENHYLVFTHIPFYHPESPKAMGEYNDKMKNQAYLLLQDFCKTPSMAIFSGHLHHTGDYTYGCANNKQIRMINSGALNSDRNWQLPRFLKVNILQDYSLEYEEIEL